MKRNFVLSALFVLALAFAIWALWPSHGKQLYRAEGVLRAKGSDAEMLPFSAGCRHSSRALLTWRGVARTLVAYEAARVPMPRSGLSSRALLATERAQEIVRAQLSYLHGYFNYDPSMRSAARYILLPDPQVEILSQAKAPYGAEIELDVVNGQSPFLGHPASVSEKADSIEVHYRATATVNVCSQVEGLPETVDIRLPYDPALAFWLVPPEKRRPLKFGSAEAKTNFCADVQMADLKSPSMYWYVWSPRSTGTDTAKNPYRCEQELQSGRDYFATQARLQEVKVEPEALRFDELLRLPVWKISIFLGWMSQEANPESWSRAAEFLKAAPVREIARKWDPKKKQIVQLDVAAWALLYVLKNLEQVADIESVGLKVEDEFFIVPVRGFLKNSRQAFELDILLGSTDEPQKKSRHWSLLQRALQQSDIVFYIGHAGMGQNMSLENLKANLQLSKTELHQVIQAKPYQMLSILSCHATGYFGSDYLKLRKKEGLVSDFMATATDGYLPGVPLSVMFYLDLLKAGQAPSLLKAVTLGVRKSEVILMNRQRWGP